MRTSLPFVLALGLAGCSAANPPPPITNNPVATVAAAVPLAQAVVQGLQDSEWNLDQAIAIGVLPATDPADACLHAALTQIGQEPGQPPANVQSFVPKVSDLISGGSVLYILAQQALAVKGQLGGLSVPVPCEALIGQFVLQAGSLGMNALPTGAIGLPARAPR